MCFLHVLRFKKFNTLLVPEKGLQNIFLKIFAAGLGNRFKNGIGEFVFAAYIIHLETQIISLNVVCPSAKVKECSCSGRKAATYF